MDPSADTGTLAPIGGPVFEQESSLSGASCQRGRGDTILQQLLEFERLLLEVVDDLQIQRDGKTLCDDQISKLLLEKQELEWEKDFLQHQSETMANQNTEALMKVQKQFQSKIRNTDDEKGKYKILVELKDKEINNLKEELKSQQLLKYNLKKKAIELEQKLVLQSRSKDSHLRQLGDVEKRFSALSGQCIMVKQALEKHEQNVAEAVKMNTKLKSANGKQQTIIVALTKELEEVSKKLNLSIFTDKTKVPEVTEWRIEKVHQKLDMETKNNKTLMEENLAGREEKHEVLRSLQHTQQLLLDQTQAVTNLQKDLQIQKQQYQALKQEHEVMLEKSEANDNKEVKPMKSSANSGSS